MLHTNIFRMVELTASRFFFLQKSYFYKRHKKIENTRVDSEKSINLFEMKKKIGYLIIYRTILWTIS